MRVLVVDQDSAMLETIVRSLRDRYTIDAVTNKGDCLDLMRQNTFEVIVAGERLEDGSGLELLGQVAKRWPSMLRIFAADPHRLELLRGRLGPFELFQTLHYPLDPDDVLGALTLADAAQQAHADTANIQHVVLAGDMQFEEPDPFPPPRPEPRAAPEPQGRPKPPAFGDVRTARDRRAASRGPASAITRPRPALSTAQGSAEPKIGVERPPPVRFPPIQASPRRPTLTGSSPPTDLLEEAVAIAREARSSIGALPDTARAGYPQLLVGGAAVLVAMVGLFALRSWGSRSEPLPRPAVGAVLHRAQEAPVVQASSAPASSPMPQQTQSAPALAPMQRHSSSPVLSKAQRSTPAAPDRSNAGHPQAVSLARNEAERPGPPLSARATTTDGDVGRGTDSGLASETPAGTSQSARESSAPAPNALASVAAPPAATAVASDPVPVKATAAVSPPIAPSKGSPPPALPSDEPPP